MKKKKVNPKPNNKLKKIDFWIVVLIPFLFLAEEASETEGRRRTETEWAKVEGNKTRLSDIPVKTP